LEAAPVLIGVPIMAATWRRFAWTSLAYRLAFGLYLLLVIGGHYHYARLEPRRPLDQRFDYDLAIDR
jgi:putative membrane protein